MDLSEDLRKKNIAFKLGTDEHLDYISERTKKLEDLIVELHDFNDNFELLFPNDKESGEVIVNSLHILHSALSLAIDRLEQENYKNSFATCLGKLRSESSQLVEYIEDLNEFILSDDEVNLLHDLH
ncbi:MAG: hypothetical protein ACTHXT_12935 [Sphingobacterium sp.]